MPLNWMGGDRERRTDVGAADLSDGARDHVDVDVIRSGADSSLGGTPIANSEAMQDFAMSEFVDWDGNGA